MDKVDFEKIRKEEFPATNRGPYLNAAGSGLNPRCVVNSIKDFLEFSLQNGLERDFGEKVFEFADLVRSKMAKLIHAETSEIAVARSTSDALSSFANGIRFKKGENVITNDIEFPSNVYPWLSLKKKGVRTKLINNRDGKILAHDIEKNIDENTRLITISSVSFLNGFRAELEKIGRICKERKIYFVVDAIQQIGALDLDVKKCHVDMLASGCYKWLMVPADVAFLFVDKNILEELDIWKIGWWNVKNERAFFETPGTAYDLTFKDDARRFQESHPPIPGIYGLNASLDLIFKIGIENIEKRVLHLTGLLINGARELGIRVLSPLEKEYRSGIVLIDLKNRKRAYDALVKNDICTSLRAAGIRLSPHFYNNEKDIEKILRVLENWMLRNNN